MNRKLHLVFAFSLLFIFLCSSNVLGNQIPIFDLPADPIFSSTRIVANKVSKVDANEYHMNFVESNSSGTYPADFNLDLIISATGSDWNANSIQRNIIAPAESGKTFNYSSAFLKEDGQYKAWHSATSNWLIAGTELYYSTSTDGINYTGHGKVLENSIPYEYDSRNINSPDILAVDDTYHLYYTASVGTQTSYPNWKDQRSIAYATSSDGISWTKQGVVIDSGLAGDFDSYNINRTQVLFNGSYF